MKGWVAWLADLQRTVYPHKWSPVTCRSSAEQRKFACQRPTFYHCATQPLSCFSEIGPLITVTNSLFTVSSPATGRCDSLQDDGQVIKYLISTRWSIKTWQQTFCKNFYKSWLGSGLYFDNICITLTRSEFSIIWYWYQSNYTIRYDTIRKYMYFNVQSEKNWRIVSLVWHTKMFSLHDA